VSVSRINGSPLESHVRVVIDPIRRGGSIKIESWLIMVEGVSWVDGRCAEFLVTVKLMPLLLLQRDNLKLVLVCERTEGVRMNANLLAQSTRIE
jgi:hypothetical protein